MKPSYAAIVLAAGQGTRMKSPLPKVLHPVAGWPLVSHVVAAALGAGCEEVVAVVGTGREQVEAELSGRFGDQVAFALQAEQLGTGHAAQCGLQEVGAGRSVALILCGDTPLLVAKELAQLLAALEAAPEAKLAMFTTRLADPTGYGRIVRSAEGNVSAIVEHKDCTPEQILIQEVNPGLYAVRIDFLREALPKLQANNAQNEIYLTDVVALAATEGGVVAQEAPMTNLQGINDRQQLFIAEQSFFARVAEAARKDGNTISEGVQIGADVTLGSNLKLHRGVALRGKTQVDDGAELDVGAVVTDSHVQRDAYIKPYSVITESVVGQKAQIGPFSHLRPKSQIGPSARVGNFVETKNLVLAEGAKANHLAYLGDGDVGPGANVGAGTIFCNYDGFQKHRTTIEAGAFIGSDSQLVAPVTIGAGAYVGTGTTVTKDVPADALALGRIRQENKLGYGPKLRARLEAAAKRAKAAKAEAAKK